jgi:hypothetical protein
MLFVLDIGNTETTAGLFDGGTLLALEVPSRARASDARPTRGAPPGRNAAVALRLATAALLALSAAALALAGS